MSIRAAALVLSFPALALPVLAEETRHADAHVHGVSHLQIAVEGKAVEAELTAPGADVVGFEHAAQSDSDKAAVEAALTALRDPAALFGLAGCAATEIEAHLDREGHDHDAHAEEGHAHEEHDREENAEEDHDREEHAGHDHDHEHEHDEDAHAEHDHEDHADDEGGHSEFHAIYALACEAEVTALDLSAFFAAFPNAAEVEIEAITDHGAHAHEATRAAAAVDLR